MNTKLYSAWYCPFAQRAWTALINKNVDFKYVETDPYDKTEQWMKISLQTGQVPVLHIAEDLIIVDSNRAVELIDHQYPKNQPLFSPDASKRAEQKYWIDFVGKQIIPYFYRYLKNDLSTLLGQDSKRDMLIGLEMFIQAMNDSGPFFSGESIDAVDIVLMPFAYRINLLLKHYRDFTLPVEGVLWQRFHRWYSANLNSKEFVETASKYDDIEARLIEFYLPYSLGGGHQDVTAISVS